MATRLAHLRLSDGTLVDLGADASATLSFRVGRNYDPAQGRVLDVHGFGPIFRTLSETDQITVLNGIAAVLQGGPVEVVAEALVDLDREDPGE